jgi:cytochrome c oxidase subunit 2
MTDFIYSSWGALVVTLLMQIPFLIIFFSVVNKKAFIDNTPAETPAGKYKSINHLWIAIVLIVFFVVNFASVKYMPTFVEANTEMANVKDVNISAVSWKFDMSERNFQVGDTVRFLAKSEDTMHSFALYHPDGEMLFTMMLMPGLETASALVHTFDKPGIYMVRCLEYCGANHHGMRSVITVAEK